MFLLYYGFSRIKLAFNVMICQNDNYILSQKIKFYKNFTYVHATTSGWDFYGHPSILDDTKSLYLTRNVWWNYRTLSRKLTISLKQNTICHRKKLPVTGRNFLSKEETSSQGKKLPVKGRNILSQEETSSQGKKLPVTERSLLSQ
jgi:hypothetical protein